MTSDTDESKPRFCRGQDFDPAELMHTMNELGIPTIIIDENTVFIDMPGSDNGNRDQKTVEPGRS